MSEQTMGAGSEPVIGEDGVSLTWGKWEITANVRAVALPTEKGEGSLSFIVELDFHGDNDGGERGMYGKLATGGVYASIEEAVAEACAFRPSLLSEHEEKGSGEAKSYRRSFDLTFIIEEAAQQMRNAMKAASSDADDGEEE